MLKLGVGVGAAKAGLVVTTPKLGVAVPNAGEAVVALNEGTGVEIPKDGFAVAVPNAGVVPKANVGAAVEFVVEFPNKVALPGSPLFDAETGLLETVVTAIVVLNDGVVPNDNVGVATAEAAVGLLLNWNKDGVVDEGVELEVADVVAPNCMGVVELVLGVPNDICGLSVGLDENAAVPNGVVKDFGVSSTFFSVFPNLISAELFIINSGFGVLGTSVLLGKLNVDEIGCVIAFEVVVTSNLEFGIIKLGTSFDFEAGSSNVTCFFSSALGGDKILFGASVMSLEFSLGKNLLVKDLTSQSAPLIALNKAANLLFFASSDVGLKGTNTSFSFSGGFEINFNRQTSFLSLTIAPSLTGGSLSNV